MTLAAFAPEELPIVGAALLMLGTAAWLLYLDFNHRVVRAMALLLVVRGLSNLLGQYVAAPGALPPDWILLARVAEYLPPATSVAALYVAVALLDPEGKAPWAPAARAGLALGGVVTMVLVAAFLPPAYPFDIRSLRFPNPVAVVNNLRYILYLLIAVILILRPAPLGELRARAYAGLAFALDPVFLGTSAIVGVPLGLQPAVRSILGSSPWIVAPFALALALAGAFLLLVTRHAAAMPGFAHVARQVRAGLALAVASAFAVIATLALAPSWTIAAFTMADAVWTGAMPVLFAGAAVHAHLFGIRRKVRRAIRESTVVTAFLAAFLVASEVARAVAPPGVAPYVGVAGTAVLVLVVGRLHRLGDQMADYALGSGGDRTEEARRLEAYRAALQAELEGGAEPGDASRKLRPVRAQLGISDRDHAVIEHMLRKGGGASSPSLRAGELFLGRYRVARGLGQGGAGSTYLCRDERVGRDVVVKALRAPQPSEDGLRALVREARAIGALNHPNVVTLHDIEQVGSEAYIVMEHVPCGSLARRLAAGALPRADVQRLARDLLDALEAVHGAGLVHRDVKPSNILFAADGRAKLADFGIAHIPGFETTVAGQDQAAVGTVRYMSPEQALGHQVTHRSDLYSAAATLYEALAGKPYLEPRPGESAIELQMRAATVEGFDRPVEPPALRAWFARALHPRAAERFQDARSMRDALGAALAGSTGPPPRRRAAASSERAPGT